MKRIIVMSLGLLALVGATLATAGRVAAATSTCFGKPATIVAMPGIVTTGTSGADVIIGTSGDDVIRGGGGNDRICSRAGDDNVKGGRGDDKINLGSGDDVARGGGGADRILGKRGRDMIWGDNGKDILKGGSGFDTLRGGKKADVLSGNSGADSLRGNGGADLLRGGTGVDACAGGLGLDTLRSCNELVPFGPNPFVGWWDAHDADGSNLTMSIDPAGNQIGYDDATFFCGIHGAPGAAASWVIGGAQMGPTSYVLNGDGTASCLPVGMPPVIFPIAWSGAYTYDPASDTITLEADGTCHWRRVSSAADCT